MNDFIFEKSKKMMLFYNCVPPTFDLSNNNYPLKHEQAPLIWSVRQLA